MGKRKYLPPRCIDIDPATVKDAKVLEAIQKLQQMVQEGKGNCEMVKQSGIFHRLVQPLTHQE